MRPTLQFSIAALALTVVVSACRDASATSDLARDELKRDLDMAATATINLAAPPVDSSLLTLEGRPQASPVTSPVVRRGAGSRAVRAQNPTVRAEAQLDLAAVDESEVLETVAEAPAPEITEPVAVAPRPTAVVIPVGSGDYGSGGGIFGGGSGGVVIRGGGVDGDNCELHRRGRTGSGPVYRIPRSTGNNIPNTAGSLPPRTGVTIGGGLGGARRSTIGASRTSVTTSSVQRSSGVGSRPTLGRRGR